MPTRQAIIKQYSTRLNQLLEAPTTPIKEINQEFRALDRGQTKTPKYNVPGVYLLIDENDQILYAGMTKTKTILHRVGRQHVYEKASSDLRKMANLTLEQVRKYKCKYVKIKDARERMFFEHFAIAVLQPPLNK